jgi:dTDP-4-dehydrorhamnose 3,5-epimerase
MNVVPTSIPGVLILEPEVYGDERGFFFESYNARTFKEKTGINAQFVQDNHSRSGKNVVRGLHYQIKQPQSKLVRVTMGEVFDVVVDIRKSSPTFGKWVATTLSADNKRMLWIPPGFAHGFFVISEIAELLYKTTDYWAPAYERCIIWNDPQLNISWPLQGAARLSAKDQKGVAFPAAEVFP